MHKAQSVLRNEDVRTPLKGSRVEKIVEDIYSSILEKNVFSLITSGLAACKANGMFATGASSCSRRSDNGERRWQQVIGASSFQVMLWLLRE